MSCDKCNDKHPIIWTSNATYDNNFTMSTTVNMNPIPFPISTCATNLVTVQTCDCECHNDDVTEEEKSQVEKSRQEIAEGKAMRYSAEEYQASLMNNEILDAMIDIVEKYGYVMGGGIKPEDGGYSLRAHITKKEEKK